jgi:hypothetical protein
MPVVFCANRAMEKSPEEAKDIQPRSSLAGIWAHQIGKLNHFSNSCLRFFAFI